MHTREQYSRFEQLMKDIADVRNATALLQWDQETFLPPRGAAMRGQQISTLSEISHRMFTDSDFGRLLRELSARDELNPQQRRNVDRVLEDHTKSLRYPPEFVRELSAQVNRTFHAWLEARKKNDYAVYRPELEKLVSLKKKEADLLGYEGHIYNALLDDYEKGCTVEMLDSIFAELLPSLREMLDRIMQKPAPDDSFLKQHFPKEKQWEWGNYLVAQLGFDFSAGRQDLSEHPFSISFNRDDVRITTRVDEKDLGNMTWSCIHEAGHALYEQGLPAEYYGLPLGEACSYSIHESQSRLWENMVGRGLAFWKYYYPELQSRFPAQLGKISLEQFHAAINRVRPSLIRTEADELTYHFHVFIRYGLEKKLLEGDLDTKDIPAYWNESYNKLLGVTVPDDRRGCLQDVHWSHGSFGYFPTYSLGSFYAAQFYETARHQVQSLEDQISKGNTKPLLNWLCDKIYAKGRYYLSGELCREVTGETLRTGCFRNYLLEKYSALHILY